MADPKTMLVMPGKKVSVSRLVKQLAQTAAGVAFGTLAMGVVMVTNGLLTGRGSVMPWINVWLGFVKRPEIITTMVLTAAATVLVVYWHRDKERGR
ncbi:MAG: hypothetical protein ABL898_19870 [Hyphomicrobiaceae bacterium]